MAVPVVLVVSFVLVNLAPQAPRLVQLGQWVARLVMRLGPAVQRAVMQLAPYERRVSGLAQTLGNNAYARFSMAGTNSSATDTIVRVENQVVHIFLENNMIRAVNLTNPTRPVPKAVLEQISKAIADSGQKASVHMSMEALTSGSTKIVEFIQQCLPPWISKAITAGEYFH